jgi:putative peptidoglycan lipid II flippase
LFLLLGRRGYFRLDRRAAAKIPRIAAATAGMALVLWGMREMLASAMAGPPPMRLAALAALVAAGLVGFAVLAFALRVTDWRELRSRLGNARQPTFDPVD